MIHIPGAINVAVVVPRKKSVTKNQHEGNRIEQKLSALEDQLLN